VLDAPLLVLELGQLYSAQHVLLLLPFSFPLLLSLFPSTVSVLGEPMRQLMTLFIPHSLYTVRGNNQLCVTVILSILCICYSLSSILLSLTIEILRIDIVRT
jgi:hypothetical protein